MPTKHTGERCRECGRHTKYMFKMNDGIYCEKHKEYGYIVQASTLAMEAFKERVQQVSDRWRNPINIRSISHA